MPRPPSIHPSIHLLQGRSCCCSVHFVYCLSINRRITSNRIESNWLQVYNSPSLITPLPAAVATSLIIIIIIMPSNPVLYEVAVSVHGSIIDAGRKKSNCALLYTIVQQLHGDRRGWNSTEDCSRRLRASLARFRLSVAFWAKMGTQVNNRHSLPPPPPLRLLKTLKPQSTHRQHLNNKGRAPQPSTPLKRRPM